MTARDMLKSAAQGLATICALPAIVSFAVRGRILGRDRALEGSTQRLARVPGIHGQYLRRAFLAYALEECATSATIEFGVLFSKCGARIGPNAYIGPRCHIGLVTLEKDVLLAAGVHVTSGAHIHGTDDVDTPIREQPGAPRRVTIGAGSWVGSAAVVMADVGAHSVIGAGAVVSAPIPDRVVAAGVPARVIRSRQ